MTSIFDNRRSKTLRRTLRALLVALPALLIGSTALADPIALSVGHGHGKRWHRPHHFHHHHRFHHRHGVHFRHVYRPPVVVYRRVVVDRPVVVTYAQTCTHGLWRHVDGSMVEGVACKQPDGSWRMEP